MSALSSRWTMSLLAGVLNLLAQATFLAAGLMGRAESRTLSLTLAAVFASLGAFWMARARRLAATRET
jgi:hypothetical protein